MNIEVLLWIQDMRNSYMDYFFQSITFLAEDKFFYFVLGFLYWSWNKEVGICIGFYLNLAGIVNTFVKSIVRRPRPFLLDNRIKPVASAEAGATGFSFPSGHTSQAMSIYGGIAFQKKVKSVIRGITLILAFGVAFSRMYLGVHTPCDVIVASMITVAIMLSFQYVKKWLLMYPKRDIVVAVIVMGTGVALAWISYIIPYDQTSDTLCNNMYKTYMDMFKKLMMLAVFLICWIIDRRKIQYQVSETLWKRILVFVIGGICIIMFNSYGKTYISDICGQLFEKQTGKIIARGLNSAILILWVYGLYPYLIMKVRKRII